MNTDAILQLLKEGNTRFVSENPILHHASRARRLKTALNGQLPHTTVLSCSDSRVPPELVFDQGIGELFVVRVAGNICGPSELGSLEFSVAELRTPLLLVLGHSNCGAVTAALSGLELPPHAGRLLDNVRPAIHRIEERLSDIPDEEAIRKAVRANVRAVMENIRESSAFIRGKADSGEVLLTGAVYDLHTGKVEWLAD